MFQSFEVTARPEQGPPRLDALRAQMKAAKLDGFVIPRADAHQGEYVSARDARLAWLTGFTGSAGFCVALRDVAGVFIDGRYRTQVKAQVAEVYTPVTWPEISMGAWLREQLPQGGRVGFDPWLHTVDQIAQTEKALAGSGVELVQCANLVDAVWDDQPAPPMEPAKAHPIEFAGETHLDKRTRLAQTLVDAGERAAVITLPDSICWLLNIRGADIERNPVVHGFAILNADASVDLFSEPSKYETLQEHLGDDIRLYPPSGFLIALAELEGPVRIDTSTVPKLWPIRLAITRPVEPSPARCQRHAKTRPKSKVQPKRTFAMVRRWSRCCAGWMRRHPVV